MYYEEKTPKWITPTICVCHACNLDCIYCYEDRKDTHSRLTYDKALEIIDSIFDEAPPEVDGIEFCLIGGEPLLEFDLIRRVVEHYEEKADVCPKQFIFSATTNGTLLTQEMKDWFRAHKDRMILCLSLDGTKETHDHNRSGSFDKIDLRFFLETYPKQGVKMTLSDYSLPHLYENCAFIHSLGFKRITGVNLYEGDFDFSDEAYIKILVPQLKKLVDLYAKEENSDLFNQLFDKRLELTQSKVRRERKNCGMGSPSVRFYDVDGQVYPCVMCTPMTLDSEKLAKLREMDLGDEAQFIDRRCNQDCFIYPICSNCTGSNYRRCGDVASRDYSKCKIKKLEALFCAELMARRILRDRNVCENDTVLYHTIQAIKEIKRLYWPLFAAYLENDAVSAQETGT